MRPWTLRTLSQKLCVYIGAATGTILLATVLVNYAIRRNAVEQETNSMAIDRVQTTAQNIDAYVDRVAMLPRSIAARQEAIGPEPDANTQSFLVHVLDSIPPEEAYGVYIAFESKRYSEK